MLSQYARQVRQVPRPIRYFTTDESRFGLHTIIGRLITACGVKPIGQWQWLFKAFWLYGAVEPATGESFFLQFSHVDTDCYQRFLDELSVAYSDSHWYSASGQRTISQGQKFNCPRKYYFASSTALLPRTQSN